MYKTYTTEAFVRTEAVVYLLDHPLQGHASTFTTYGLFGVHPTVFIRSNKIFGYLIKYVEHDLIVAKMWGDLKIVSREIQKFCITHIRFGYTDGHAYNTLVKRENEVNKLIVIYCEDFTRLSILDKDRVVSKLTIFHFAVHIWNSIVV